MEDRCRHVSHGALRRLKTNESRNVVEPIKAVVRSIGLTEVVMSNRELFAISTSKIPKQKQTQTTTAISLDQSESQLDRQNETNHRAMEMERL
jgi:hypothetical protein